MVADIVTDCLIVGAGPAGLSLGSFLAQHGLKGLIIAKDASTAKTPRAHGFNPFAFECLRDVGLEEAVLERATSGPEYQSLRWCRSMVGEGYAGVLGFGAHPASMATTATISPCEYVDLAQSNLEPVFLQFASHHGFPTPPRTEWSSAHSSTTPQNKPIRYRRNTSSAQMGAGLRRARARLQVHYEAQREKGMQCVLRADLDHIVQQNNNRSGSRVAGLH
ncbi:FAD binding domain-containing protein [Aspergillus tetrazonus]